MKVTNKDLGTLARARFLRDAFQAGIFPDTIGDVLHFKKLERQGLIVFDGYGRDVDGIRGDVAIYQITPQGSAYLDANRTRLRARARA